MSPVFSSEVISIIIFLLGIIAAGLILIYSAFASEEVEAEEYTE
jgi:hypothetical protein